MRRARLSDTMLECCESVESGIYVDLEHMACYIKRQRARLLEEIEILDKTLWLIENKLKEKQKK